LRVVNVAFTASSIGGLSASPAYMNCCIVTVEDIKGEGSSFLALSSGSQSSSPSRPQAVTHPIGGFFS
jgi:hypothetical protein